MFQQLQFELTSLVDQETVKEPCGFQSEAAAHGGGFILSLVRRTSSRKAANYILLVWFDPTENQTKVYGFGDIRSIHSTAD